MSIRPPLPAVALVALLSLAACTSGGAPTSTSPATPAEGTPGPATEAPASEAPDGDAIAHPTGADEVVLRFDEAGGFVPPEWLAARLPYFTLYGDGRVIFTQTSAELPVRGDNVFVGYPLRTGMLTEEQVQGLLRFALVDGGLAVAKTDYQNPMVADAPTAVFTINAENDSKTVSVVALGLEGEPGVDSKVLAQLAMLGERLRDFDSGGSFASEPYLAPAYRAVILEQQGIQGVQVGDWPWSDVTPADFKLPEDPNVLQQGTLVITPEQAAAVGVEGFENGISSGVYVKGDDGKVYSLVIRPLLPDELP